MRGINKGNAILDVITLVEQRPERPREHTACSRRNRCLYPPLTALAKYRLEVAFKQGTGILAVLLGIGAGRRYGLKGLVENSHNALLLGERGV